jgi:Flp pilus assembly pilin Flp
MPAMKETIGKWMVAGVEKAHEAFHSEKGQTMIEYALVAVLIAIVLVFIFANSGIQTGISKAGSKVNSALQ